MKLHYRFVYLMQHLFDNATNLLKQIKTNFYSNFNRRFTQFCCGLLIISLLTVSNHAAVPIIVATVTEVNQDTVFYVQHNKESWQTRTLDSIKSVINSVFSSSEKDEADLRQIARVRVSPADVTIGLGEKVNFVATAFDAGEGTISAVPFSWKSSGPAIGGLTGISDNGVFEAVSPGVYTISAESFGVIGETKVTVTDRSAVETGRKPVRSETREVSTQTRQSIVVETTGQQQGTIDGASIADLPEPGNEDWNNNNWSSLSDPGNETGNPPGNPIDNGALSNNFQFSAPVVTLAGRGSGLSLNLNYNARLWNKAGNDLTYDIDRGFPAPGWNLGMGKMAYTGSQNGCMIVDAEGTRHGYYGKISTRTYPNNDSATGFSGYTTDGTLIDYSCGVIISGGVTSASGYAKLPNGTYIDYGAYNDSQMFPTSIRDAHGNYITVSYRVQNGQQRGPEIDTIKDNLGRDIVFNYDTNNRLISVTVPGLGGAARDVVRLNYRQINLNSAGNYGFAGNIIPHVRESNPYIVDSIYYPETSTGFWFGDVLTASDSYSYYGMITKVLEQREMGFTPGSSGTQGTISSGQITKQSVYNYPLTANNTLVDSPSYTTHEATWAGMDDTAAVTSYELNNNDTYNDGTNNIASRSVTITQPNNVKNKQYTYKSTGTWKDGLIAGDKTFVMNGSVEQVLNSSRAEWFLGQYSTPLPSKNWTTDERGQTIRNEYDYTGGQYNQLTKVCQYGYTNNLLQCERSGYENRTDYTGTRTETTTDVTHTGNHVYNLVKWKELSDENDVRVARTEYEYDNNYDPNLNNHGLTPAVGVVMHYAQYDPHTTQLEPYCSQWSSYYCCNEPNRQPKTATDKENEPDAPSSCPGGGPPSCRDCLQTSYRSVFQKSTMFRGDLTKVISYSDVQANSLSGQVSQALQYDVTGNKTGESSSAAEQTTYGYTVNNQFAYPETTTTGSSDVNSSQRITTSTAFDFNTGLVTSKTDANGRVSTTTYNSTSLRPTKATLPTGAYSVFQYDDGQMTITEESREASTITGVDGRLAQKTIKYLNGLGKVKKETTAGANETWEDEVLTTYDKLGRVWKQSRPYRIGVESPQWKENFYDALDRIYKTVAADGSVSQAIYNGSALPDSATNAPGKIVCSIDPWGRERWMRYDERERMVEVVEPNPNGDGTVSAAGSLVTKYIYNTQNNLIETIQGVQHRTFAYDSLGRLIRQKLAEQSATLNDAGQYVGVSGANPKWSEAYGYDDRSILIQKTDARGVITSYDYLLSNNTEDPLRRLSAIRYTLGTSYDSSRPIHPASNVAFEYAATGDKTLIKKVTTDATVEDYAYDPESRLSDYILTITARPNQPMATSYDYDTLNRVTNITYPKQYDAGSNPRRGVHYDFDKAGRVSGMNYNSQQQAGDFIYNAMGQTASVKIGTGTNQITEEYSFDAQTGLLSNQQLKRSNGDKLLDLSYEYRRKVNGSYLTGRSGQVSEVDNNLDRNKNRAYEYDKLGRLVNAKGGLNATWSQTYTYDRFGNRTNVVARGTEALRSVTAQVEESKGNDKSAKASAGNIAPAADNSTTLAMLPPTGEELVGKVNSLVKKPGMSGPSDSTSDEDFTDVNAPSNNNPVNKSAEEKSLEISSAEIGGKLVSTDSKGNVLAKAKSKTNSDDDAAKVLTVPNNVPFDFDNDNIADLSVWNRTSGVWSIKQSSNSQTTTLQLGGTGNQIVPADYDGDGKTDRAVWNTSTGIWSIKQSSSGIINTVQWGQTGDAVVPADYDGDGKADIAVWRPSNGVYYIQRSSDNGYTYYSWGNGNTLGDIPVIADYNGDGRADFIVWRPSNGDWFITLSSNYQYFQLHWGQAGDVPVAADYDGDGLMDLAVWRPSTGAWYITQSSNSQYLSITLGSDLAKDILSPADFDGDGKTDAAVFTPSTGTWTIRFSTTGNNVTQTFGTSGDLSVPSAFIRRSSAPKVQNSNIQRDGLEDVTYDSLNNHITNANFEYDVMGNLVKALAPNGTTIYRYEYDSANRLKLIADFTTNVGLQRFGYGADNRRLIVEDLPINTATIYGWAGKSSIAEYSTAALSNSAGSLLWSKSYVFSGEQLLSTITPGGGVEIVNYHHPDRLGTRIITNPATGSFTEQTTLPFGNTLSSETSGGSNRVFTSYDRSSVTGLDYAVNRTYDTGQGRFTQVDPIGMKAVSMISPQTLNLYTYCGNDPVNHTDPDGLFFGKLFRWLGKIFKFLAAVAAVIIAVLTIIVTSPGFLMSVSLITGAISEVLGALGYSRAAAIFGLISAAASFGATLLATIKTGLGSTIKAVAKSVLKIISAGAKLVSQILTIAGHKFAGQIAGLVGALAGFDYGSLSGKFDAKKWWELFKFARSVAAQVATIAGAATLAKILEYLGIVEDAYDIKQALYGELTSEQMALAKKVHSTKFIRTLLFINAANSYIDKIVTILPPEKKAGAAPGSSAPGAISSYLQPAT